jgi:hypothetical protein
MSGKSTGRRVTMQEAADELGLTVEAIRKRIQRGSIASDKGPDGRRYVYLDESRPQVGGEGSTSTTTLVAELRDRVRFLERELERKDAILLNMTEAMKAIGPPAHEESPSGAPGSPETATEQPGRVGAQTTLEGSQRPLERVPWWRRMFGG